MALTADKLRVKIYADGADKASMLAQAANPLIKGFTTNPTLMHKAGVRDYEGFARDVLKAIPDRPISFEVFSDDFAEMYDQALYIAAWAPNVYVKIPIINTKGESAGPMLAKLAARKVKMNVTAIFTEDQARIASDALGDAAPSNVSVFAGRIADAGHDPMPLMRASVDLVRRYPSQELIWASPRELYNLVQAHEIGCHILTAPNDMIAKLGLLGRTPLDLSFDAVKIFRTDSLAAGFSLRV